MKKTLLVAASIFAAGILASQAQVYSQNIVGYVNAVNVPNYTLCVAPLQAVDLSTNAEEVLGSGLQGGDSVLLWNGGGYDNYVYSGEPGLWIGPDGPGNPPTLNAGQAFFYQNVQGANETNTYVGTVVTTNNNVSLVAGYTLIGSVAPISQSIDSTNYNLPFNPGDGVLLFNGDGFDNYVYSGEPGLWIGPDGPGSAPSVSVAQGFFYQNVQGSTEYWTQTFQVN